MRIRASSVPSRRIAEFVCAKTRIASGAFDSEQMRAGNSPTTCRLHSIRLQIFSGPPQKQSWDVSSVNAYRRIPGLLRNGIPKLGGRRRKCDARKHILIRMAGCAAAGHDASQKAPPQTAKVGLCRSPLLRIRSIQPAGRIGHGPLSLRWALGRQTPRSRSLRIGCQWRPTPGWLGLDCARAGIRATEPPYSFDFPMDPCAHTHKCGS